jgi:hypothetical protein
VTDPVGIKLAIPTLLPGFDELRYIAFFEDELDLVEQNKTDLWLGRRA